MLRAIRLSAWLLPLFPSVLPAQPVLHLKTRDIVTGPARRVEAIAGALADGRGHVVLQFGNPPTPGLIAALEYRGIKVLGDVPQNGLLVSIERPVSIRRLGARFAAPLRAEDKISPLLGAGGYAAVGYSAGGYVLVAFHRDADMDRARAALLNLGLPPVDNPDLHPNQLMIQLGADVAPGALEALGALDEVAYVFPASPELARGIPVRPCTGALTVHGTVMQSIAAYGDGWDGPGLNPAALNYVFSQLTAQLDPSAARAEILRAMQEWSKVVKITWNPATNAGGAGTVNILFAGGAHGDGFSFDGRGNVLAHTFYPAPPNPEPIAGDMHLDDTEPWRIGANTDLFSVALHELGHALGLGHADDPNAVMYPYYRMASTLSETDKAAIRTLYAAQDVEGPSDPSPLILTVNTPPLSTTSSTLNLTGSVTGGTGTTGVTWSANGATGTASGSAAAWSIIGIPLVLGSNAITITATAGSAQISKLTTITRLASMDTGPDTTAPMLTITSPSTATFYTAANSLTIKGTASDNVSVKHVVWNTNFGTSGIASGTTAWSATVPLLKGNNTVIIRASDAAGNTSWRSVVVSRR